MKRAVVALAFAITVLVSCGEPPDEIRTVHEKPLVCTTIHPLAFFVTEIAGDLVDCEVVLPRNRDPRRWTPDRSTLQRLATADLVVFHGAGLESWRRKVGLPISRQVVACTGLESHYLKIADAITHTHGKKSHTHEGIDPFVWLDLGLAARQAAVVRDALAQLLPGHAKTLTTNLERLQAELAAEHKAQRALGVSGRSLFAADRCYGYWARSVGAQMLDLDTRGTTGDELLRRLNALGSEAPPGILLCSRPRDKAKPKPPTEKRVGLLFFDPCFTAAPGSDFLDVMAANRKRLRQALERSGR